APPARSSYEKFDLSTHRPEDRHEPIYCRPIVMAKKETPLRRWGLLGAECNSCYINRLQRVVGMRYPVVPVRPLRKRSEQCCYTEVDTKTSLWLCVSVVKLLGCCFLPDALITAREAV